MIEIHEGCESGGGVILEIADVCEALQAYNVTPKQLADLVTDFLNARGTDDRRSAYHLEKDYN